MLRPAACLFILLTGAAAAGEAERALIDSWYKALAATDRVAIGGLLGEDAKITLGDLDIVQTRAEFMASLDEWEDAMKGASIRHAIESDQSDLVTAIVCYRFSDNESLTREVFSFSGRQIRSSEQETVAGNCADFPG
jgi:hypothetical protein